MRGIICIFEKLNQKFANKLIAMKRKMLFSVIMFGLILIAVGYNLILWYHIVCNRFYIFVKH